VPPGDSSIFDTAALLSAVSALQVPLDESRLALLERYARLVIAWNQRVNLTAVVDPYGLAIRHFADSLSVAAVWRPSRAEQVVDVGAGAGFPGLVVKVVWPQIALTLVEATGKKAAFLLEVVRELELGGVTVVAARAEEAAHRPDLRERFDIALARAVAPLPTLLELTVPFLKPGGRAILHKAGDVAAEATAGKRAMGHLGAAELQLTPVTLPALSGRLLVEVTKRWPTPASYPRRPGIPRKHPLGSGRALHPA
jgi:16S rRNA (guanine527-N7)-methyltransferase